MLVAIVSSLDPYVVLRQGALGLVTFGIIMLQAMAAIAIVVFFRRRGQGRYLKTLVPPGIGAVALGGTVVFGRFTFDTLLGIRDPVVDALPGCPSSS